MFPYTRGHFGITATTATTLDIYHRPFPKSTAGGFKTMLS